MRTIRMIRILPLLLLAACASAGTGPRPPLVVFRVDGESSRHVVPYPVERVWAALPLAYADLQLPAGYVSRAEMELATPQLRVDNQLYGRRNSEFMDCGIVAAGTRLEDHGEVTLAMITRLEPAPGGTLVMTQMDASARRREGASNMVECSTRGVLEQAVVDALLERLQDSSAVR